MPERRFAFLLYEFPSPTQTFVVDQRENLLARLPRLLRDGARVVRLAETPDAVAAG
jgi:hypothetical protein